MSQEDIQVEACRGRQRRVLELMQRKQLDLVVVTQIEHVQYLAGPRFGWLFQPAGALSADGKLTLVAPNKAPEVSAADQIVTYLTQRSR
jgi:Xaa-Pro dipeptidase